MEKMKRWQFALIAVVIVLTLYNILPTILFYAKPLNRPIRKQQADGVAAAIIKRVDDLEVAAIDWLKSYNKLLGLRPSAVSLDVNNPQLIHVRYHGESDAKILRKYLPRAGMLIPFVPAQLSVIREEKDQDPSVVTVQRNIPIHFEAKELRSYFKFTPKHESGGTVAPLYREVIEDRLTKIGLAVGGMSENAQYLETVLRHKESSRSEEFLHILSQNILTYAKVFGENSPIAKRYYATLTQGSLGSKEDLIGQLISHFEGYRDQLRLERISLEKSDAKKREDGGFLDAHEQQRLSFLQSTEEKLFNTIGVLNRQKSAFSAGHAPWNYAALKQEVVLLGKETQHSVQSIPVGDLNPLIKAISIDWNNDHVYLELNRDIEAYRATLAQSSSYLMGLLDQLIYNEIARINRETNEVLLPHLGDFIIHLNSLTNSQSLLILDLRSIAKQRAEQLSNLIRTKWKPLHPDLQNGSFPIYDYTTFNALTPLEQKVGLVIYTPAQFEKQPLIGFKSNSVYVIARGIHEILNKLNENPDSPQSQSFVRDFTALRDLLQVNGFYGYPGTTYPLSNSFAKDFIFEAEDFYHNILRATRENFTVHGTGKYATLEFTDLRQRILASNEIKTRQHEDLLKWRDAYRAAQVSDNKATKREIPAPTRSPLLNNLSLSFYKYFHGDERKILHWGLDLSGGKSVQIQLRDTHNRVVTDDVEIGRGIDELYSRVNKIGVSEVLIRREGSNVMLDFPSAQGFSAAHLVKASSMQFHIVNEKFTPNNSALARDVNTFLQDVWNRAVVTNRKDVEGVNQIAWEHLYGNMLNTEMVQPMSEAAKTLYDQGLRLSPPNDITIAHTFNDSVSKIALLRGENISEWHGQSTPLLIVMKNYALEGANLTNVHAAYDPSKGNFLSFQVKGSQTFPDGQKINPRNELYSWTSAFSKEKVQGTPLEKFTRGEGWRMAVILNGAIVSMPTIASALRDNVSISGSFTQGEVNRLEADLRAGSLSFTPHILSEKNVSPELGIRDRIMGIIATVVALVLVISVMVAYYRFAGVIASIAVLLNLLLIWATLQNIAATVTLAGIAGIILTLGMAVDANVLVFERIREEFFVSKRIAQAVHAGYRRAFSAILDSNVTTIIAALILLHFDSGPIKGFAITLIIGIISSMFTALFMTRYFFMGWVRSSKNRVLNMANMIKKTHFDFLKYGKASLYGVAVVSLVGCYLLISQRNTIFGMDFTGGYSASLEIQPQDNIHSYSRLVEKALITAGAAKREVHVREFAPANNVQVLLDRGLDQEGRPFFGMPLETDKTDIVYAYQNNPRLAWTVAALEREGLQLTPQSLRNLGASWASISGQMSSAMRNNAIIGLSLALICILVYITLRFEFKYAISATLGLAIDSFVTVSIIAIFHLLRIPVQIDLNTIAAIMTIIGYSLNDTIIIFDRIREDLSHMRKLPFKEVVNHALNVTLSRTIMTSGTTLVVLLALLFLGGSAIFGLSLVMVVGVVFGTFSSLFVTAPILLLFFYKQEGVKMKKLSVNES